MLFRKTQAKPDPWDFGIGPRTIEAARKARDVERRLDTARGQLREAEEAAREAEKLAAEAYETPDFAERVREASARATEAKTLKLVVKSFEQSYDSLLDDIARAAEQDIRERREALLRSVEETVSRLREAMSAVDAALESSVPLPVTEEQFGTERQVLPREQAGQGWCGFDGNGCGYPVRYENRITRAKRELARLESERTALRDRNDRERFEAAVKSLLLRVGQFEEALDREASR